MASAAASAYDLAATYLHIKSNSTVVPVEVDEEFWARIHERTHLHEGRMVMLLPMTEDWPTWERHPAGDEIVYMLSGAMYLVLKLPVGERSVSLTAKHACIVPRGIWHTGKVREPGEALFITPGVGTENRPLGAHLD